MSQPKPETTRQILKRIETCGDAIERCEILTARCHARTIADDARALLRRNYRNCENGNLVIASPGKREWVCAFNVARVCCPCNAWKANLCNAWRPRRERRAK